MVLHAVLAAPPGFRKSPIPVTRRVCAYLSPANDACIGKSPLVLMGSRISTQNQDKARSDVIDRQIKKDSKRNKVNILLLGTDPNMSTIVKQMKIQHGLTNDELMQHRLSIYEHSLHGAQKLVRVIHNLGMQYTDTMNDVIADHILGYRIHRTPSFIFSPKISMVIHHLWQDPVTSKIIERHHEPLLDENDEYFLEGILRIGSPDYSPTDNDILQVPRGLRQVIETRFTFGTMELAIIDVGRRALPRAMGDFGDPTCIMFCASLGDYDIVLEQDARQNRLNESLTVFESIVNSRRFLHSTIILVLTDTDEFKYKILKVPLERYFPEYSGSAEFNEAFEYVRLRFAQANRANLPLYFIQYCATDSTALRAVLQIARKTVLGNAWRVLRRSPSRSAAIYLCRLCHTLPSA